ncbi:Chalcone isomerase [Arabidopsis thaliana x Arabidopsis arenosa]|uniref:Chalcone isomerase n=2 Tax=Arabidopsis TaxID=3701 RepID=A0A8T2A0L6_ARASU|nr:Chalcone isomerase [Arabidopsis thaliana x Arabidopsis arenosa]KAG7566792.1 Chalcone isomerase [Arabidopsis suecica]
MVSFRFPFSFSQPPRATSSFSGFSISAVAVSVTVGAAAAGAAIAASRNPNHPIVEWALSSHRSSLLPWGSITLADSTPESVVEPKTGFSFPASIGDSRRLLGVGLRKKSLLGLKNIDVYAFGVYADCDDVKKLVGDKYANLPASEIRGNKAFMDDLMEADIKMTIRLQIVYGKLNIRSVRNAFQESVGNRLKKFGGSDNDELLQSFTSLFKDEYKIPRNSTIDLTKEPGHVLCVAIEGNHVGSVQSQLLCRSILDLYIGEEPFDKNAREDFLDNAASLAFDN